MNNIICDGFSQNKCPTCNELRNCQEGYLKWYLRIPFFIIDNYLHKLSGSSLKIYIYLNRRANFEEGSNHYGRCWLNYGQISEATGVSSKTMRKYMKELEDLNLISHRFSTVYDHKAKTPKTIHQFTVKWYSQIAELKKLKKHK